jgi:hypothetical protein
MEAAAVAYAERLGFAVFGVAADCRTPLVREGWFEHGCHDASKDPAEVRRRWREAHPRANVAVATGDPSGVFVLDIDRKGDVDGFASLARLEAEHGPLPETWRTRTPSGGEHRWFRKPEGRALVNRVGLRVHHADGSKTVWAGLDIRTTGGSVAVPPSRKPTGKYEWVIKPRDAELPPDAPEWLLQLIDPPPLPPRATRPLRVHTADRTARYVATAVNDECGELARMGPNTGRNLRLFQASANLGALVGAGLLPEDVAVGALERAAADCGLVQEDGLHGVRATINSGLRRGLANPREVTL